VDQASITRAIADQARTIRIPVYMMEVLNRIWSVQNHLTQLLGREATAEEIADELEMPVARVRALLRAVQKPGFPPGATGGEGEETSLADFIEDPAAENPSRIAGFKLLKDNLGAVLFDFNAKRKNRAGIAIWACDGCARTLEEVGQQLKVTRERIRQIEAKGLRKVRRPRLAQIAASDPLAAVASFLETRKTAVKTGLNYSPKQKAASIEAAFIIGRLIQSHSALFPEMSRN